MSEELRNLGEVFRDKRKELNMSLKEVENATSIRSFHLEAIEEGRIGESISAVYAQGFIKQYGNFLGMDMDRIMSENSLVFQMPGEKHEFAYGIGTLEMRGSQGGGIKWFPSLLWAGSAAFILIVAWYLAKFLGVF